VLKNWPGPFFKDHSGERNQKIGKLEKAGGPAASEIGHSSLSEEFENMEMKEEQYITFYSKKEICYFRFRIDAGTA
jgi:hypothetical protein